MDKIQKMHSIISSAPSELTAVQVYDRTINKYNFKAIRTINEAMKNESPSLVVMQKKDKDMADNIMKLMLAKTARSFNITRNIEPGQIIELVETLNSEYYYLKLSEVFYILKQAKLGKFGKTYERLDEPTILSWFNTYVEERFEISEQESLKKHEKITSHEKQRQYDNYFENEYKKQQKEENKVLATAKKLAEKMVNDATKKASKKIKAIENNDNDNSEPRVAI
jgi:hypothetical protein